MPVLNEQDSGIINFVITETQFLIRFDLVAIKSLLHNLDKAGVDRCRDMRCLLLDPYFHRNAQSKDVQYYFALN